MTKKLLICLGTHAEYIKMFPIIKELEDNNLSYEFISTGQHDLTELVETFGTSQPSFIVNQRDGFSGQTGGAFKWGLQTLPKLIKRFMQEDKKSIVVVHGDTISTSTTAVAARIAGLRVAHIESGLRSGDLREPFPEEIMRIIVDWLAKYKFNPTEYGNTIYDTIRKLIDVRSKPINSKQYAVATIHRHENIKSKERLTKIIKIINACPIPVYFAIHDNTKKKLEEYGLRLNANVFPMPTVPYKEFLNRYLKGASLILTDGGSMQEECAYFGIPCAIMRMQTERKELLKSPSQFLTKLKINPTIKFINRELKTSNYCFSNPYLRVEISTTIVAKLLQVLFCE